MRAKKGVIGDERQARGSIEVDLPVDGGGVIAKVGSQLIERYVEARRPTVE